MEVFRFSAMPISECGAPYLALSDRTRRSITPSDWVAARSALSTAGTEVYVCEAFGGASSAELVELILALEADGKYVILLWTDDWAFPRPDSCRALIFDVSAPSPLTCTYGWDARRYGPSSLGVWRPFEQRPTLASFVGSRKTHRCRDVLFSEPVRTYPQVVIEDVDWWGAMKLEDGRELRRNLEQRFENVLSDSKFVFCPRGNGPSSKRRWEAAYVGAIPVLIDDYSTPFGVDVPAPRFFVQESKSPEWNSARLVEYLESLMRNGSEQQESLRRCLLKEFDSPLEAASHTSVRQIVRLANSAWIPEQGFVTDLT
jgi:hypothetical protein